MNEPRPLLPLDGRMTIIPLALAGIVGTWIFIALAVAWMYVRDRRDLREDAEVAYWDQVWHLPARHPRGRV